MALFFSACVSKQSVVKSSTSERKDSIAYRTVKQIIPAIIPSFLAIKKNPFFSD
tara:strand:- start:203 stop:364 length:162 start_codon:yes stop_codon:yes gene_type:complete